MLIRRLNLSSRVRAGIGQFCLVLGILLSRSSRGGEASPFGVDVSDFWQGLLAGLAGVLLGVSIPLNLMAVRRWRQRRD